MATLTGVPVEEYLRTSYEPETEYVDGQLVERHLGDHHHSSLLMLIGGELLERSRERRFRVFGNQTIRINETRYRVPDICVKALPYRVTPVLSQPDLVIEIVSPDDTPKSHLERIRDYQAAAIPFIWVVDPYLRTLVDASSGMIRSAPSLVVETPLVGQLDFGALFEQLYEPPD